MDIRIARIVGRSTVDGPGSRTVLFVQGCHGRCPGCQSPDLHDPMGGAWADIYTLARWLIGPGLPITISGGEPFYQAGAVANLVATIRGLSPEAHIVVYSGYTFEQLLKRNQYDHRVSDVLYLADVLVDGPYVADLDDDFMQWRGSSNQRAIDLRKSAWTATEVMDLVLLDWDSQVLTVTEAGEITGTAGEIGELFGDGSPTRMCGQVV